MVEEGGAGLSGPLEDGFVSASSPAGPSAWFVCGGPNGTRPYKGPAWFFALSFVNALLFLVHPQVPASRMPLSEPIQGKRKHYTPLWPLECIPMVSHHSQGGRELNLEQNGGMGTKEFWLDGGKKRSKAAE